MREEVKKARKQFDKSRPTPAPCCDRCGMTKEMHVSLGKSSLQVHHVESIRDIGMEANRPDNYHTLCYFCHREWHCFWECAGRSYEDFFEADPFFVDILPSKIRLLMRDLKT